MSLSQPSSLQDQTPQQEPSILDPADLLPLRRSNRGKGKSSGLTSNSSNLNDDKLQFCLVEGIEYRVGDYVYFQESDFEYFTIGLVEEIKLSRREKCSLLIRCFWRRWDISDEAQESLYERENQEAHDYDDFSMPSPDLMKRELFISDLQINIFSHQLKGICTVIQLNELSKASSLLDSDPDNESSLPPDTFFYVYSYDPETKRVSSTRTEPKKFIVKFIKIGSAHQPEIPDIREPWSEEVHSDEKLLKRAYENFMIKQSRRAHCENCPEKYQAEDRLSWEELIWKPCEIECEEDSLKTFLDAVRSIVAFMSFGGANDDESSAENGLVLANSSATTQHAYNVLYRCNFDIEESLRVISQEPVPCDDYPQNWTADQVRLFYYAMSVHGKDFHAIQKNFFDGSYQIPNPKANDEESIENRGPSKPGKRGGYRRTNSIKDDISKLENNSDNNSMDKADSETNDLKKVDSDSCLNKETLDPVKAKVEPFTKYPGPEKSVKQLVAFYYYWKKKNTQAGIMQQGNLKSQLQMRLPPNGIDNSNGQNGNSELILPPSQAIDIAKRRKNQQTSYSKSSKFRKAGKASNSSEASRNVKGVNVAQRKGWIAIHENRQIVKEKLASILRERSGLPEKVLRDEDEEDESEEEDENLDGDDDNQDRTQNQNNHEDNASESSSVHKEEDFQPAVKIYLQKSPNDPLQTWSCKTNEEANVDDELDRTIEAKNSSEKSDEEKPSDQILPEPYVEQGLEKKTRICRNCRIEIELPKVTTKCANIDVDGQENGKPNQTQFNGQLKFLCTECRIHLQRYGELRSLLEEKNDVPEISEKEEEENPSKPVTECESMQVNEEDVKPDSIKKEVPLDDTLEEVKPHSLKADGFNNSHSILSENEGCFCKKCSSTCSTINGEGFCCKHQNVISMNRFDNCCCCKGPGLIKKCSETDLDDIQANDVELSFTCNYENALDRQGTLPIESYYLFYNKPEVKILVEEKYGIKRSRETIEEEGDEQNSYKRIKLDTVHDPNNNEKDQDQINFESIDFNEVDSGDEEHMNMLAKHTATSNAKNINVEFIDKTWCRLNRIWDRRLTFKIGSENVTNSGSCARTDLVYRGRDPKGDIASLRMELYCKYASTALGPGIEQLPAHLKEAALANSYLSIKSSQSMSTNMQPVQKSAVNPTPPSPHIPCLSQPPKNVPEVSFSNPTTSNNSNLNSAFNAKLYEFAKVLNQPGFSPHDIEKFLALNGQLSPDASPELVKNRLIAMGLIGPSAQPNSSSSSSSLGVSNMASSHQQPHPTASLPQPYHLPKPPNPMMQFMNQAQSQFNQASKAHSNQVKIPNPPPPAHCKNPPPKALPPQQTHSAKPSMSSMDEFQKFLLNQAPQSSNPQVEMARLMAMGMFGNQQPKSQPPQQMHQAMKSAEKIRPPPTQPQASSKTVHPQSESMKQQQQLEQFQNFLLSMSNSQKSQQSHVTPPSPHPTNSNMEMERARMMAMNLLSSAMASSSNSQQQQQPSTNNSQINSFLQNAIAAASGGSGGNSRHQNPSHQAQSLSGNLQKQDHHSMNPQMHHGQNSFIGSGSSGQMHNPLEAFTSFKNSNQISNIPGFHQSMDANNKNPFMPNPNPFLHNVQKSVNNPNPAHSNNISSRRPPSEMIPPSLPAATSHSNMNNSHFQHFQQFQNQRPQTANPFTHRQAPSNSSSQQKMNNSQQSNKSNDQNTEAALMSAILSTLANQQQQQQQQQQQKKPGPSSNDSMSNVAALNAILQQAAAASNRPNMGMMRGGNSQSQPPSLNSSRPQQNQPQQKPSNNPQQHNNSNNSSSAAAFEYLRLMNQFAMSATGNQNSNNLGNNNSNRR